ncbi:MAG: hypothetical protein AAFV45_09925 [Pseudomonadota bacterium]
MGAARYAACCLAVVASIVTTSIAQADVKQTFLLALAACPPWKAIPDDPKTTKLMANSCQKDIETIVPALQKSFSITPELTSTRLNEQADFAGIETAIKGLAEKATSNDRVVIYLNFHGGELPVYYKGYVTTDELLAAYTKDKPKDFAKATKDKVWMTVRYLRDLVDQIKAEEIIVIFEACESDAGMHDFRYDLAERYKHNWQGREAVIFSSRANQAAAYNAAGTKALFTDTLANQLMSADTGNMRDHIETASITTHRSRRQTCMNDDNRENLFDDRQTYLEGCTQRPEVFDPYGLLDDIQIGGVTDDSHWRKMQKLAKADAPKIKAKKAKEAAKKAAKKAAEKTAKAKADADAYKHSPVNEDPFAWAKPFLEPTSSRW